jgi:hypothetical protein
METSAELQDRVIVAGPRGKIAMVRVEIDAGLVSLANAH